MSNGSIEKRTATAKVIMYFVIAFIGLGGSMWGAVTFFTPRSMFDHAHAMDKAVQGKMTEIQHKEREISRMERKLLQYNLEWLGNSTWLNNLEENFPDENAMSTDLKRQKKKVRDRQEKITRKLARYETELEQLEKDMNKLELDLGKIK